MASASPLSRSLYIFRFRAALVLGTLLVTFAHLEAAEVNARSPSLADVSTAVALAKDGDTVIIPAGSATWNSGLTVPPKGISILGAGLAQRGRTVINHPSNVTPITISVPAGKNIVVGGITLVRTDTTGASHWIHVSGTDCHKDISHGLRIHHVSFEGGTPSAPVLGFTIFFNAATNGVVDHCYWGTGVVGETVHVTHSNWNGTTYGDGSWASPSSYGSNIGTGIYFEDNVMAAKNFSFDADSGGRTIVRHTYCWGNKQGSHGGVDSSGDWRGTLNVEYYNNI